MQRATLVLGAALCLLAASTASADVQVTMQNGRVSVIAKDATLRQIMTEWARVGQTKVVNVERIPGGPITLELRNVTEDQALDVLMRPLSGYVAAPRAMQMPNLSRFDRIVVMPTIAAARQPTTAGSAPAAPVFPGTAPPTVTFQQPTFQQPPVAVEEPEEPPAPNSTPRGPVFTAFPQPQVVNPNTSGQPMYVPPPGMNLPGGAAVAQPAQPTAVPTAPVGVAVPGMMVPTPTQPGAPNPPTTPVRRPGGL
jgi:hypothetical protein